jgi:hypothetical protein
MNRLLRYLTRTIKSYGRRRQDGAPKGSHFCSPPVMLPSPRQTLSAALTAKKKLLGAGALGSDLSHAARTSAITVDQGLAAAGTAVALLSFGFALFMVSQNNRRTGFERDEVFHVSPKLSNTLTHFSRRPLTTFSRQSIDFGATGSIVSFQARHEVRGQKAGNTTNQIPITTHRQSASYILSFVYKKMALVEGSHGLYATRVGTALPDAGKVMSIEKRGNQWILVAERAIIAEGK